MLHSSISSSIFLFLSSTEGTGNFNYFEIFYLRNTNFTVLKILKHPLITFLPYIPYLITQMHFWKTFSFTDFQFWHVLFANLQEQNWFNVLINIWSNNGMIVIWKVPQAKHLCIFFKQCYKLSFNPSIVSILGRPNKAHIFCQP